MRKAIILSLLLASAGASILFAEAQFNVLFQVISLNVFPPSPAPGETFIATASTPSSDKNRVVFDWFIDGRSRPDLSGTGKNSITLIAGSLGSVTRVAVEATRPDGTTISEQTIIRVTDLSVAWFAETYVPKWYRGKALPSQGSVVNFVAIPQIVLGGRTIPSSNLIYTWGLDDNDNVLSGTGQNVFRIKVSNFPKQTHDIILTVEDMDKSVKKEARIFIGAVTPLVGVYKTSPLGGVEPRSASTAIIAPRGTIDLVAEPFFFPIQSKKALTYHWNANGLASLGSPDNPDILTLNTNENTGNEIVISLSVDNNNPYVSTAARAISLFLR